MKAISAILLIGAVLAAAANGHSGTERDQVLRVIAFSGVPTLPIRVAEARGLFAAQGLKVITEITPNSPKLRSGLGSGTYHIAHAAVDNAVAMVETENADVVIVMGGDDSMNEFVVQPEIGAVTDLKGKIVIVDAPNTAYALQARRILARAGLRDGDYELRAVGGTPQRLKAMLSDRSLAASMLNPPFSIQAMRQGLRSLGTATDLLGPYQGMGAFVRRDWARQNQQLLVRYLTAFLQAQRWFVDPANRPHATALLAEALELDPLVAAETYERGLEGLAADAQLDLKGLRAVLALRAEVEGQWDGTPPPIDGYYDLTYYQMALVRVGGSD